MRGCGITVSSDRDNNWLGARCARCILRMLSRRLPDDMDVDGKKKVQINYKYTFFA